MNIKYLNASPEIELEDLIIGQLLRQKRKDRKVTIEQVSKVTDITVGHLSVMETIGKKDSKGKYKIRVIVRAKMRAILKAIDVDYLGFMREVRRLEEEISFDIEEKKTVSYA